MSDKNFIPGGLRAEGTGNTECDWWEALLADAQDGSLSAKDQAAFDAHTQSCPHCAALYADAEQGRAWASMLREHPPVPRDLLDKILTRTEPLGAAAAIDVQTGIPAGVTAGNAVALPFMPAALLSPRGARDARMLMTAAMAFFSIALTLSLLGFRITDVHAAELKPSTMQANLSRQFYGTKKQVVSFYDNLRFVLEVESEVRELRQGAPGSATPTPQKQEKGGSSHKGTMRHLPAGVVDGSPMMASDVAPQRSERNQA